MNSEIGELIKIRQAAKNKGTDQNVRWRSGFVICDALFRFGHEEAKINPVARNPVFVISSYTF